MQYRANGRVHDMRPTNAKSKVAKMQATKAAGAAGKEKAAKRAVDAKKAARRGKMQKAGKALSGVAEQGAAMEAQAQAETAEFNNRAAGMQATRERMQQSTPGRAAQIIKNRRA